MTTTPQIDHDGRPTTRAAGRGYGWSDRAGRQRHAGIGTREEIERNVEGEGNRNGRGTAERNGTADRNGRGPAARNGGAAQRRGQRADVGVPDRHQIVVPDEDDHAVDPASDDEDYEPRLPLVHNLRFVNESPGSLRELLRFAREAHYNMSHVPLVRAFHIAFFWLVTTPVLSVGLFLLWAFAIRLHRALTALVLALVLAPAVRTIPVVGWLVPEWLVVTTWSATAWQWAGGGLVLFAIGVAIVMAGERRR